MRIFEESSLSSIAICYIELCDHLNCDHFVFVGPPCDLFLSIESYAYKNDLLCTHYQSFSLFKPVESSVSPIYIFADLFTYHEYSLISHANHHYQILFVLCMNRFSLLLYFLYIRLVSRLQPVINLSLMDPLYKFRLKSNTNSSIYSTFPSVVYPELVLEDNNFSNYYRRCNSLVCPKFPYVRVILLIKHYFALWFSYSLSFKRIVVLSSS